MRGRVAALLRGMGNIMLVWLVAVKGEVNNLDHLMKVVQTSFLHWKGHIFYFIIINIWGKIH